MFQRLRHPIRAIREPFGTAGLVIAVFALIFALAGGAYAASGGLTGKQKKEVKAIAKSLQGTGPAGSPGPAGPGGSQGSAGSNGKDGTNGKDGSNGQSVKAETESPGAHCSEGGVKLTSASGVSYVCNGEEGPQGNAGSPWTLGGTLPSGATETGAWILPRPFTKIESEPGPNETFAVPISFSIPLVGDLDEAHVHLVTFPEAPPAGCENSSHPGPASFANPEAVSGNLCVYALASNVEMLIRGSTFCPEIEVAPSQFEEEECANPPGAILDAQQKTPGFGFAKGTWAVTG
jgi:hypothetical protein